MAGDRRTAVERPILVQGQDHCKPVRPALMAAWTEATGASQFPVPNVGRCRALPVFAGFRASRKGALK